MKKTFQWGTILLGSIVALDAVAVPRPKPGSSGEVAGHTAGIVMGMPIWVTVAAVIVLAILVHQVITRRKR
ncbi:MAG: hypothetical protein ACRENN_00290 [Candidatus Eiseniibacteriota bacterium]